MSKSNLWEDVYDKRITPNKEIEQSNTLLKYDGSEIFVEGTMSCIVGGAKSRKTFAMSLLLEQMINPTEPLFESNFGPSAEILYFDTEMSERRIQEVSKRFSRPEIITFLPIRQYSILDRYKIIEEGIQRIKPNIVVIDGYKELTVDINDQIYSTKLTNKLLQWTTEFGCHVTGVLHTNPQSEKPRGALGTELCNKCSSVMHVESRGAKARVKSLYSRDKEFNPFVFTIDEHSIPQYKDGYGI